MFDFCVCLFRLSEFFRLIVLLWGSLLLGKTTLLKILAGKHMVGGRDVVRVLNLSAFHDTNLVCSGNLAYLGDSWSRTVGSAVSFLNMNDIGP